MPRNQGSRALAAALVVVTLLAGGCTTLRDYVNNGFKVGPDYRDPGAAVAEDWIDADPHLVRERADDGAWWAVFHDPTLDTLIADAHRQNLDLKTSAARVFEARAQRNVAAGNLLPQTQTATAAYAHAQLPNNLNIANFPGAALPSSLDVWEAGFNLSWEIDFWGRLRRQIEADNALLDASVEDYRNALVSLVADVATNYVQARTFQQRLAYARKNVELQKKILVIVERRLHEGAANTTGLDVEQIRATVAQTEATIPPLEIGLRQANGRLCVLLGRPSRELFPSLEEAPIPEAPPEVAVGIPADLLRRRPDVRRAERQAAAQCAQIGVADAAFYPRVGVLGTLGYASNDIRHLFEESNFLGLVVPNVQWQVLNYGRTLNNVRTQDARFQEHVLQYQQAVLTAGREVEDALVAFVQFQLQARALEKSVRAAERSVELVQEQVDAGRVDYNRVYTTQTTLVTQEDQLAVARGNVALNLIAVYRALGGGWKAFEDGPCVEKVVPHHARPASFGSLLDAPEREDNHPR